MTAAPHPSTISTPDVLNGLAYDPAADQWVGRIRGADVCAHREYGRCSQLLAEAMRIRISHAQKCPEDIGLDDLHPIRREDVFPDPL